MNFAKAQNFPALALRGKLPLLLLLLLITAGTCFGQSDPWSNIATKLAQIFIGPIARGFSLVAIVVGGLSLAFSEGGGRRAMGGLLLGCGLAMGATQFLTWLFV